MWVIKQTNQISINSSDFDKTGVANNYVVGKIHPQETGAQNSKEKQPNICKSILSPVNRSF